jgi:RNA polymerase sigma-70 factor (ECF subfamily)
VPPDPPDETELICRARQGEAAAFRGLVEGYGETLWRCARALCRDDHEAEDLAQETFTEAWRSLGRFDESRRFSTWLYGILRHRFLKARQKRRPLTGGDEEAASQTARDASPPFAAEQAEEARLIQAAVAALPEAHRVVIELRFFAGASLSEIAALVGCPLGTVKSRLHHGLEKLRLGTGDVNLFVVARESSPATE